jgi:DNA-binding transcriptional ArsR family regulator
MQHDSLVPLPAIECEVPAVHPERVQRARRRLLLDEAYGDLAETFRVLADSTRAKIVHLLAGQPMCVCDLAEAIGISDPAVSQHMRLLRSLRIVRGRREGKNVIYTLEDAHVRSLLAMALNHSAERDAGRAKRSSS